MFKRMTGRGHSGLWRGIIFTTLLACAPALFARDAFVLLSGGNSPFDNNYSQYLQARAMADFFERNYPPDSVWIFFGAGNVRGEKPVLADVCQETQRDNFMIPSWLPGALPHNLPARRSVFLSALRNEILPAIADGGTLFLFVGDHETFAFAGAQSAKRKLISGVSGAKFHERTRLARE